MSKPKIRFKGYEEDWEQRKLGDVLEEFSNKSTVEDEYTVLSSTNTGMEFRDGRVSGTSNLGYKIIEIDDLVLSPQNLWLGNININNLEKGLVSPSYKTFKLRNIDKEFFRPQLRTKKMLELYKQASVQGASVVRRNLDMDLFEQIELNIPMIEEQAKIGEYFFNLDYLITLHQRKCEETKKLKKYMLQKMFPQNGKRVPEIRFVGFTDDWEQRKLGDIFKEYSEKKHSELPALTIIQGKGTIKREESDRNLMYDKSKLDGYKMVRKNDFIVHLRSFEGGLEKASSDGIISPAYHTFHGENIDSRFYYPYFRSYEFIKRKLIAHVYGIRDGRSIDISGMKTIKIPYTSYMEQVKIGDYLDQLDNLITLHQRKYEELQKIKKFMLQNMFI